MKLSWIGWSSLGIGLGMICLALATTLIPIPALKPIFDDRYLFFLSFPFVALITISTVGFLPHAQSMIMQNRYRFYILFVSIILFVLAIISACIPLLLKFNDRLAYLDFEIAMLQTAIVLLGLSFVLYVVSSYFQIVSYWWNLNKYSKWIVILASIVYIAMYVIHLDGVFDIIRRIVVAFVIPFVLSMFIRHQNQTKIYYYSFLLIIPMSLLFVLILLNIIQLNGYFFILIFTIIAVGLDYNIINYWQKLIIPETNPIFMSEAQ